MESTINTCKKMNLSKNSMQKELKYIDVVIVAVSFGYGINPRIDCFDHLIRQTFPLWSEMKTICHYNRSESVRIDFGKL